ncbi:MAG: hypothetical protein Ta2G_05950 [Termitinemataceae bacterium]|nr:MAG: hypothetical protein Ta2G_05950 [Termitinemataceae bacterium]
MKKERGAPYKPEVGIKYPEDPHEHMSLLPHIYDTKFDADYPYLDKSFKFRVWSTFIHCVIFVLVFFVSTIRFCTRIEGKENLRKNKKLFKHGAMTISNHVMRWDFLCILQTVKYRRLYFPALASNINTADRGVIRAVGGIPIPEGFHAMKRFNEAFDELHAKNKWFHGFPEASSWEYYQPIRPFKKGMFTMAYQYNIPVIPIAFSWRPARGIYKIFKKNNPLVTIRIGEPLLSDQSKPRKEAVNILREQCHKKIVELAGMKEGENPYPCADD